MPADGDAQQHQHRHGQKPDTITGTNHGQIPISIKADLTLRLIIVNTHRRAQHRVAGF